MFFFFLMLRRPPRSTRTDTLFPSTTPFRSRIKPCLLRGGFDALFRQLSSAIKRTVEAAIFALLGCIQTGLRRLPAFIAQYGTFAINHLQPFVLRQQAVNVGQARSEEHTSELQSLMRRSSAVLSLKNKKQ